MPTTHRVSYKGGESRLFRRVVEVVEGSPGVAPSSLNVARTFQTCLETLLPRADQPRENEKRNGQREGVSETLGSVRFVVAADGTTFETAYGERSARSYRMSNEIAGVAKRATHRIVMEAEASRRVELANQLWFLWIESYLIATGERHNSYDYACDLAEERAAGRGRSFSVGFEVEVREGRVWISEVRDERLRLAGLVAGDEVVRLDDREIDGLTLPELQRYWLSLEPFSFTVVARRADELFRVAGESVPTRHSTLVWSVHGETGYVRIRTFSRSSAIELRRALRRLESAEARRLVLDVRGNPGGSLSADLVDMFFKPGQTIVSYLDHGAAEATDLGATVEYRGLPTAVLVDRRSASMAEVLAAAFRTHERGPVVGEKTFGKGAGQRVHAVGEEGQLNLVERTYFYPGTRESWDGTGITPTLAIEMGQEEWERLQPYVDSPLLRLDEQWELDPVLRAAEERLKERP